MTPEAQEADLKAKRISVVIVSFNRKETLRRSLAALGDAHQVLVVDNGSTDGSAALDEEFPATRFIRLPKNFGQTKALNIGIRAAEGEYVLLLHDDTIISGEAVSKLADYLASHQDAGAVAPLDRVRSLPTPGDPDPAFRDYAAGDPECVSGAAMMFRTFFLRALRHIDERYGNYGSTIELCAQLKRANRRLVILPDVVAEHESARSPLSRAALEGDRAAGTAAFIGKHHGFMPGMMYRLKTGLGALFTFRFKVVAGALSGAKIDGAS